MLVENLFALCILFANGFAFSYRVAVIFEPFRLGFSKVKPYYSLVLWNIFVTAITTLDVSLKVQ